MTQKDVTLSGAQFQVMQILWRLERATVADILQAWPDSKSPAHTTVATVLSRLEKRGVLRSQRQGRERLYQPLIQESEVKRSMVSKMVGTLFAGDPYELLTHLVKESDVSPEDLEAARRLLDQESKK